MMQKETQTDINSCSPQVIEHFVGQQNIIERIRVCLEACWNDGIRLPHILFTGPPGLGKTELAHLLAKEMGSDMYEQMGQNLTSPTDVRGLLLCPGDRDIVFIDEIHEIYPNVQTTLYRAMENFEIYLDDELDNRNKSKKIQTAKYTLIAATTEAYSLQQPLLDRFKVICNFDYYTTEELVIMLRNRCKQLKWEVEESVFPLIAQVGRGTPRIALRLLESVRRTTRSKNETISSVKDCQVTCRLEGIDRLGLGPNERKYLQLLAEHSKKDDQFIRLNVIASIMGIHHRTIASQIECYLLRIGFITKTDFGRQLTDKGWDYLQSAHSVITEE